VLCAVLTNSPNSCPSESLFSIFKELTMKMRRGLMSTKLNYRCNRNLTNERCSSVVECLDRGERGGMGDRVGRLVLV
jgi:hypothetical protein